MAASTRLTAAERRLRAQAAVHTSWANTVDRTARTAPATAASMAGFETQVDPDGVLPPEERARRAEHARKAYMAKLTLASAKARHMRMAHGVVVLMLSDSVDHLHRALHAAGLPAPDVHHHTEVAP